MPHVIEPPTPTAPPAPSSPWPVAPPIEPPPPNLGACVGCLSALKTAPPGTEVAVRPAICLVNGTGSCLGHLMVVPPQSGLLVPTPTPPRRT